LRKKPFRGVGCRLIEKALKKRTYKLITSKGTAKSRIWGAVTPKPIAIKILKAGCSPGHKHACQFW